MKKSHESPALETARQDANSGSRSSTIDEIEIKTHGPLKKRKLKLSKLTKDKFLQKLMETLMDRTLNDIICIPTSDPKSFEIKQPHLFMENVLPYRFGLRKLGAFESRLKNYGFEMTSPKLSSLELCGFKPPKKVSRKSVRNGNIPQETTSSDPTEECSILYRHPVLRMNDWESFYTSLLQCEQSNHDFTVAKEVEFKSTDSSHLTIYQLSNSIQKVSLMLVYSCYRQHRIVKCCQPTGKVLETKVRTRETECIQHFQDDKLD